MLHHGLLALAASLALLPVALTFRRLIYRLSESRQAKRWNCAPAQNVAPLRDPFLGLDFLWETLNAAKNGRYLAYMWDRFQRCGYTFVTRRVVYDTIHTIEPENLKHMLSTGFNSFRLSDVRLRAMVPLFGNGIFTTEGSQWAHSRALLRPSFARNNMAPLFGMMERHFQALLGLIPTDGSTFDLQQLFFNFTMDTATDFLLGESTHTLDRARPGGGQREASFVRDYVACCVEAVRRIQMGPMGRFSVNLQAIGAKKRAWAYIDSFVDRALEMRACNGSSKESDDTDGSNVEYNFLRELARDTDDGDVLRDQILNVLLASRDTTAGLLSNLFFMLAKHPDVYRKLRDEVDTTLRGQLPSQDALKDMTYLRWCINESLRLHPVVPANMREAAVDAVLPVGGGPDGSQPLLVKQGTCIVYHVYSMHRREDIFGEDPEAFVPERWHGLRPGWGFLPFNGGPRICLGQQFALAEASYVVVRMVQSFAVLEARDDGPWVEFHSLSVCSRNGVRVAVSPS